MAVTSLCPGIMSHYLNYHRQHTTLATWRALQCCWRQRIRWCHSFKSAETDPFHFLDTSNRFLANTLQTGGHFDLPLPTLEYLLFPVWLVTQSAKVAPPRLASYSLPECGIKKKLQVYSSLIINRQYFDCCSLPFSIRSPVATTTVSRSIMTTPT